MLSKIAFDNFQNIDAHRDNKNEIHTIIHSDIKFTYNSINVIVGQTGAGKTRFTLMEISKLTILQDHLYHLLVVVSDQSNDVTFKEYSRVIDIPIKRIKYEEAFEYLTELDSLKTKYEQIAINVKNKKPNSKIEIEGENGEKKLYKPTQKFIIDMFDKLFIDDFKIPVLHTLILYDDATNIIKNQKDPMISFILRNRHCKFTYFFNIHNFTRNGIPTEIKKSMRSLWYFGGYSHQDFVSSFPQVKCNHLRSEEVWEMYRPLSRYDMLFFDFAPKGTVIKPIVLLNSTDTKKR
jgi:hypothetical protein